MTEVKRRGRPPMKRPDYSNSSNDREIERIADQFDRFDEEVKSMTLDRMNAAPVQETEMQTKLSAREIARNNGLYLKPKRSLPPGTDPKSGRTEKFNEKFRPQYNFACEYVNFIAENKEIIGEAIELWTKPFPGMNCELWEIPTNKPVWAPRHVAEQIKRRRYHRLVMQENRASGSDGMGQYYGTMAADTTIQRLDAHPVNQQTSVFMGESAFK